MIGRRTRRAGSLVWLAVLGAVVPAGLGMSGCGRRTYPLRDPPATFVRADGSVEVGAGFDQCPELTFNVSPSEGELSQPFVVDGAASDPDNDQLTMSLKADSGKFSVTNQLPSTFTCTTPGLVTISVTVSDGSCQTVKSATVFCLGMRDGGGDAGDGSAHQDGGTGDGSGEGGITVVNNICPTEPLSGGGDGGACTACTIAPGNCSLAPSPDGTDGCCALSSAADQTLCADAAACFAKNKCTVGGDAIRCFCGTSGTDCYVVPGAANGPCTAQVIAAAKTKDPSMIMSVFTSSASPLGRAVNLLACRGNFCSMECGVP